MAFIGGPLPFLLIGLENLQSLLSYGTSGTFNDNYCFVLPWIQDMRTQYE